MLGIVVITGANRGLGLSLTKIFLEKGYRVLALTRSENEDIIQLKNQQQQSLFKYKVDVTDEKLIEKVKKKIMQQHHYVDILINNAAVHTSNNRDISSEPPDIEKLNFENIFTDFQVNSLGPLKVIKHFLPLIRKGNKKLIVNISSEAGSISNAWRKKEYGYCMSKAALNMGSKILQNRLMDEKIKVLAIHPGWFSSDMGGKAAPITPGEAAKFVAKRILQDWDIKDPIYIDAKDGTSMEW